MIKTRLMGMETCLQVEDWLTILNRDNTASRETATITNAINLVDDGHRGVTWSQKVCVK
jgi:hypothetical protein